jgi:hypothetical protein
VPDFAISFTSFVFAVVVFAGGTSGADAEAASIGFDFGSRSLSATTTDGAGADSDATTEAAPIGVDFGSDSLSATTTAGAGADSDATLDDGGAAETLVLSSDVVVDPAAKIAFTSSADF